MTNSRNSRVGAQYSLNEIMHKHPNCKVKGAATCQISQQEDTCTRGLIEQKYCSTCGEIVETKIIR